MHLQLKNYYSSSIIQCMKCSFRNVHYSVLKVKIICTVYKKSNKKSLIVRTINNLFVCQRRKLNMHVDAHNYVQRR